MGLLTLVEEMVCPCLRVIAWRARVVDPPSGRLEMIFWKRMPQGLNIEGAHFSIFEGHSIALRIA